MLLNIDIQESYSKLLLINENEYKQLLEVEAIDSERKFLLVQLLFLVMNLLALKEIKQLEVLLCHQIILLLLQNQ